MGDDCNVASRRRDNSPSSSSPKIASRKKDFDESCPRDSRVEERDFLLLARQSGEPGEGMYKILDNKRVVESDLIESNETIPTEPRLFPSSTGAKSIISSFPYFETKLRPDAPPFTPESLTRSGPASCGIVGTTETICVEPSYVPRAMIDDSSCFVNVELGSSNENESSIKDPEKLREDFLQRTKEPELRTIDVTSTPRLKRSMPKIELSIDSFQENVEIGESVPVVEESGPNEPDTREPRSATDEPRYARGYWRIIRTTFILSNRIQIAVFIAGLVICMILVIYVVV